ncbi:Endoglucanase-5 like protein [Verticillium longisporum]|nr:Endoglucanase-5 like protein [Verticillium longisporum]
MVVQATNTGADLGSNHFDLAIPGGGVGIYNACTAQHNAPPNGWGDQYGGIRSRAECDAFPEALKSGCYWRFDWFLNADNPQVNFRQVSCPAALTSRSGAANCGQAGAGKYPSSQGTYLPTVRIYLDEAAGKRRERKSSPAAACLRDKGGFRQRQCNLPVPNQSDFPNKTCCSDLASFERIPILRSSPPPLRFLSGFTPHQSVAFRIRSCLVLVSVPVPVQCSPRRVVRPRSRARAPSLTSLSSSRVAYLLARTPSDRFHSSPPPLPHPSLPNTACAHPSRTPPVQAPTRAVPPSQPTSSLSDLFLAAQLNHFPCRPRRPCPFIALTSSLPSASPHLISVIHDQPAAATANSNS